MSAGISGDGAPASAGAEAETHGALAAPKRFAAFISYAHSNEKAAARLHKQIETYRLPHKLRRSDGGKAAARLGQLFRDRADLAAADSLSEAIRDALADSATLIVLCSPAAARSRWVNDEIRLFRALNPSAPVLAAVIEGDPAAAMPVALTEAGREPLAADLRSEGDGWKLGFLKIVAALAGVPLDALIQRDAQRGLRRVMGVTAGALLAMLAAVSMMTYAIQQRNEAQAQREEAERRRAQAEGLVEFMLTDLRERLRGVGRIDIMRSAVGSALDSYDGETGNEALSADGRGQLARLLHAVGEDDFNSNKPDDAALSFRRAYAISAPLLADAPRDPDRIFTHAQSEYWLGHIAYPARDFATVERRWRAYHRLSERLIAAEPGSRRSLQERAYADGNLCTLYLATGRDGIDLCRAALASQRRLAGRFPGEAPVIITLANRLAWLADAVERRDGRGAGRQYRDEQLALVRQLVRQEPGNWDTREYLVRALIAAATDAGESGSPARARPLWAEAQRLARAMRAHDPANRMWADLQTLVARGQAQ